MKDLMGMMKQARELQEKMQSLQAEIAAMEAAGTSGAGLVTVTVHGKGGVKTVKIDPSPTLERTLTSWPSRRAVRATVPRPRPIPRLRSRAGLSS